ncbi:MAG: RagB/SusD family nutrient uptake outer membrane protein [Bacteroidetes bacterium]|nr:RagB/SusD family nutrient uptake outer membrane protein [Bacteroidota bacterium]
MKINKIIFIALMVILASCQNLLEKYPLDAPSSATFPKSKDELTYAINGVYNSLNYNPGSYAQAELYWDAASDLVYSRGGYAISDDIVLGSSTPNTGMYSGAWTKYYQSIQRSNFILSNMDAARKTIDAAYCDRIEGEAKFLRAWNYMYLTELFGDVPLITTMQTLADTKVVRTPKADVVTLMLNDLDFAASKLPKSYSGADLGRVTQGAALALKARVALYNKKYDIAATAATSVMGLGVYALGTNYGDQFQLAGATSAESIFQLNYSLTVTKNMSQIIFNSRYGQGWSILCPSQWLVDSYLCTDGKPIDQSPLYNQARPYENRDPRLKMTILVPGTWFGGVLFETHPDSLTTFKNTGGVLSRIGNQEVTNAYATFTGYLFRKNCDESVFSNPNNGSIMPLKLIRYAEVLLTYVEAKIELNQIDQSVYDAINLIRRRVKMPDVPTGMTQDQFRQVLRQERKIEMAGEGLRLFDIRRWKIAQYVLEGNLPGRKNKAYWYNPGVPTINQYGHPVYSNQATVFKTIQARHFDTTKDYLWAVPQKERDINKNMTQNPGY